MFTECSFYSRCPRPLGHSQIRLGDAGRAHSWLHPRVCVCVSCTYQEGPAGKERSRSVNDITVIGTRDKGRLPGEDDACDEPEP